MKQKPKKCDKTKPVVIVPAGMSGHELKQLKCFDSDLYDSLKKVKFRAI